MVNPRVIRNAVKYGPVIAGAAKKYGPTIVQEARKHAPAVVDEVERRTGRRAPGSTSGSESMADATPRRSGGFLESTPLGAAAARRRAAAHARSVVDGSMLQTFVRSRPVWVVFSGDDPVGTHPHTEAPFSEILRHADLGSRIRPRTQAQRTPGARPAPGGEGTTPGYGTTAGQDEGPQEPLTGTVHPG